MDGSRPHGGLCDQPLTRHPALRTQHALAARTATPDAAAAPARTHALQRLASVLDTAASVGGFAGGWAFGLTAKAPVPQRVAVTVLRLQLMASWLRLLADAEDAGPLGRHAEPAVPRPRPAG